jgi:hypothetical protein
VRKLSKLNKQTGHILNVVGNNYEKYSLEQQSLILKNTEYVTILLKLINTPVMEDDGSYNNDMTIELNDANDFLKEADEILFVNFTKRMQPWMYILPIVITVIVLIVLLYV